MQTLFDTACPGETLSPTYSFTGLDSDFVQNSGTSTVDWNLGIFTSNTVHTVIVVGRLSGPHIMTITKTVTITIYTVCTTATLAYTAKSPLTV
jgi:hypothetical protein